eukprot:TRINITY_DN10130_c0_g1_i10.p1 TRINITY_DN10130_c0_g1~~TRINITY_DN10130_c0_g1_i10.p1  ORF type:complete len:462 (+),score=125.25 TRINITY_DN10130_c0_g1_i10:1807-3192(+)
MALTSTWGLSQIILFLSNGIIGIPKTFLRNSNPSTRFKIVCCSLTLEQSVLEKDKIEIIEGLTKLRMMETRCGEELAAYIRKVLESIPEPFGSLPSLDYEFPLGRNISMDDVSAQHYVVMGNVKEYRVHRDKYKRLLREGVFLQRLIESTERNLDYIDEPGRSEPKNAWEKYLDYLYLLWHNKIQPKLYLVLAVIAIIYGIIITLGECTLLWPSLHQYFAPIGYLLSLNHNYIAIVLIMGPALGMFIAYTYYGLFSFKLSKFYGLYPHKQTVSSSLVYSAIYTAKLAFPICYNFLLLVNMSSMSKPVFERVMGVINLVPVMGDFQYVFPCIIILFMAMNACNLYNKVMKALTLADYAFVVDVSDYSNQAGLDMINRERRNQERKARSKGVQRSPGVKDKERLCLNEGLMGAKKSKKAEKSDKQQRKKQKKVVRKEEKEDEPWVVSIDFSNTTPLLGKNKKK